MSTDPVGSLAEEAAKLLAALQGWTQEFRGHDDADSEPGADAGTHHHGADSHAEHTTLSGECRYCPLCNLARFARAASPEVRDHLASAGLSLAMAFKELMDNAGNARPAATPVEKIDLDGDPAE